MSFVIISENSKKHITLRNQVDLIINMLVGYEEIVWAAANYQSL
jgi:hypothetical protein